MANANRKPGTGLMRPLADACYHLIPLHCWDAVRTQNGKTRQMGKAPIHKDWTNRPDMTKDALARAERFGNNVGVRLTAEQLVIDIDPRSIPGGVATARETLADLDVRFSRYPIVRTGSGGLHIYMAKPADVQLADHLPEWKGIELKSRGRQVVAPGSIHPNGRQYQWAKSRFDVQDIWLGAPEAPEKLLAIGNSKNRSKSSPSKGVGEHPPNEIATILAHLDPENFRDHDQWLQLMMACHHASGGAAVEEFVQWCESDPPYASNGAEVRMRWESLRRHGVGLGTLYMFMREAGCANLIDRRARVVPVDEFGEAV